MGLNDGQGCQEPGTAMTHFYMSSPFKTSLSSINNPGVTSDSPLLVNKALDFPRSLQTGGSKTPILDASCRYPSRSITPSPATLATKTFLDKLCMDIEASPLTDSFSRTTNHSAQESTNSPELEVLETLPTHSFSKTSAQSNSPGLLTAFNSSDLVDTSLCTSSPVPAETLEISCCTSPNLTPQKEVPRNPVRRLFRSLCTSNEETQLKTASGLMNDKILKSSPVIAQSEDVSFKSSMCTQEPCSTNNAGKSPLQQCAIS